ncbi:MAG TPA: DUF4388 domain-containing protein [Candidatus Eisenbacteria bacterium]|nr:DUF4388 domain-containing protein [Candidatus Eisenbacteria bacterium]
MSATGLALSGDLSLISLFDLGQLLRLNGATGCLVLLAGSQRGMLYFDRGELVNAVDEAGCEGESAALSLFAWRAGTFEFRADSWGGIRAIESGTEAVMMEAARRLDEMAAELGDDPSDAVTSETQRLRERQAAMEALRDAFHRVAGEASEQRPAVDPLAITVHLYELTEPEDRLLYRPGHPPFMRRRGCWSPVPEPPLTGADYEALRSRLTRACDPVGPGEMNHGSSRHMTLADGRVLSLDMLDDGSEESLWLRPAGSGTINPEDNQSGDLITLTELVELPESLLLLGAADFGTARRLLATVANLATGPADTLVMVSADGTCRPRTENGVTLATTPAQLRSVLDSVRPDIVALDPDLGAEAVAIDDLATVPRILATLSGHEAASLAVRWLLRVRCRHPEPARAWLAATLAGLVTARLTADTNPTLHISAWPLEACDRELALRGDAAALARRLASMLTR